MKCACRSLLENPSTPIIPLVSFSTRLKEYRIIGSCNGLLCLYHKLLYNVRLWNPSIELKSKLSPKIVSSYHEMITHHGFGYDQVNDKYKVLYIMLKVGDRGPEFVTRIYTFGENSWITVSNFPCEPHGRSGIYASGTLILRKRLMGKCCCLNMTMFAILT